MSAGCGLPQDARVRRRPEFLRAYSDGRRVQGRFMTLFLVSNTVGHARLGVSASRKLGRATERNRLKRLTREVFRRHRLSPGPETEPGIDVIVVPRREMLDAPFASLQADYANAIVGRHQDRGPRRPRRQHGRKKPHKSV